MISGQPPQMIQIFIKEMDKTYTLYVMPTETIASVMKKFMQKANITADDFVLRFVFAGKILELNDTLETCRIQKESTIHQQYSEWGFKRAEVLAYLGDPQPLSRINSQTITVQDSPSQKPFSITSIEALHNPEEKVERYDHRGGKESRNERIVEKVDLHDQDLSSVNWGEVSRIHGNLIYLKKADLHNTKLTDAWLAGMDLQGVDFSGADLSRVNFTGADLTGANFSGAKLEGADLRRVKGLDTVRTSPTTNFVGTRTDASDEACRQLAQLCTSYLENLPENSPKYNIVFDLRESAYKNKLSDFMEDLTKNAPLLKARRYVLRGETVCDKASHAAEIFCKGIIDILATITVLPTVLSKLFTGKWVHNTLFSVSGEEFVDGVKNITKTLRR